MPATPPASKEREIDNAKKPVSSALGLFDDDLDNDDLFGIETPTQSKSENKQPEPAATSETMEVSIPEIQPKSTPMPTATASAKVSLFGDDDDDNDLFGGPPSLPEPSRIMPKKAVSKIFTDDSSDDDLFGSGGGGVKPMKKLPSKSNVLNTSAAQKAAKDTKAKDKLFSDSEDDDLFGTKSKPKGKMNTLTNVPSFL